MPLILGHSIIALGLILCLAKSAPAATVTLTTGETLEVTILEHHDASLTVEHPVLGKMEIPRAGVTEIVAPAPETPAETGEVDEGTPPTDAAGEETSSPVSPAEATPPAPGGPSFWATLFPSFDSKFELGVSGASGNTDTGDVRIGLRTRRESDASRTEIGGTYQQSASSGTTIRDQANAFAVHDWLFPDSPWFTFVNGNYDYDQFRAWDHRVSGFGGVGFDFLKTDTFQFTVRTGGGLTREFGGNNELRPEGLISAALAKWKPTDAQTVSAFATVYPDLSEFFEFRFLSGLEWLIAIDQADGLSLKFGIENEYESVTAGGEKHNDLKYYGAIVVDF